MNSIILNTFRQILRSKFVSLLLFLGVIFIGFLTAMEVLSLGQTTFILPDFGFSFIEISALFLVIVLSGKLLVGEFEEKTIYLTLSRPIKRSNILLGKFFGFSLILLLFFGVFFTLLAILFWCYHLPIVWMFILIFASTLLKMITLVALSILFSLIVSPVLAIFLTFAMYVIGHSGYVLQEFLIHQTNTILSIVYNGILLFFPNFLSINIKDSYHSPELITENALHTIMSFSYSILYIIIVFMLAVWIFKKKKFDNI